MLGTQAARTWATRQRLAWPALAAVLALAIPAQAQLSADESQRLVDSHQQRLDANKTGKGLDTAAFCRAVDAVRDLAYRNWTRETLLWFSGDMHCRIDASVLGGRPASPDEVQAAFAPMRAHWAAAPAGDEEAATLGFELEIMFWRALLISSRQQAGIEAEADAIQPLVEALHSGVADPQVERNLQAWVNHYYGARSQTEQMQHWHGVLSGQLGPGHRLTLGMLRCLIFNARQTGRPQLALERAEQASQLAQQYRPEDKRLRMAISSEYSLALGGVGRYAESRQQALQLRDDLLAQRPQPHGNLMRVNYNLAALSRDMGDLEAAITHAEASIHHARQAGHPMDVREAEVAAQYRDEARLLRGDSQAADALQATLAQATVVDQVAGSAAYLLARHALREADPQRLRWAVDYLQHFANLHLDPAATDRALLIEMAALAEPGLDEAQRQTQLRRAAALTLSGRSLGAEIQTHFTLARHVAVDQPDSAVWLYKRAANALHTLRNGLPQDDDNLHRVFLAEHEPELRAFIGLLIDRGRLAEAQQAITVLRSEELHEYTRRSGHRPRGSTQRLLSFTPDEQQRETGLRPTIDGVRDAMQQADARADADRERLRHLGQTDPVFDAAVADAALQLRQQIDRPPPAGASPAAQSMVRPPAGQVRLQYFIRPDRLDIVLASQGRLTRHSVSVSALDLNRTVQALRAALATPGGDHLALAQRLYRWLIAPVAGQLGGATTLRVAADGVLRYVPMAALHDGRRYAAERWTLLQELADSPTAGAPSTAGAPPTAGRWLLALGRTLPDADHAALPGVADELASLRRLQPAGTVVQDSGFTAEALRQGLARHPAVVHLASHFVLDPASDERSYLLLGDGTRLSLPRLSQLPWQGVHLALLSACDSGVATTTQGRELAGFAGALQQAGVAHVLATLWPVTDHSTAAWMADFYAPWQRRPPHGTSHGTLLLPRADWVAAAQRAWLKRHAGSPLAHPHHWAGFAWMGS